MLVVEKSSRGSENRPFYILLVYPSGHGNCGHVAHSTGPRVQFLDKCLVSHGLRSWLVALGLESWVLDGVIVHRLDGQGCSADIKLR